MFAAAMTIVGGAHAWTFCDTPAVTVACEMPVWDLKMSGKMDNDWTKGYKTVSKLAWKGFIVGQMAEPGTYDEITIIPGEGGDPDTVVTNTVIVEECCLESFNVLIFHKSSKTLVEFEEQEVGILSLFGKGFEKTIKPGKTTSVEADVFWTLEGDDAYGEEIALQFVGFGKAKYGITKGKANTDPCGDNSIEGCEDLFTWPDWNGWFTGFAGSADCIVSGTCEGCVDEALAGGTWSGKYNKKLSAYKNVGTLAGALKKKVKAIEILPVDEVDFAE